MPPHRCLKYSSSAFHSSLRLNRRLYVLSMLPPKRRKWNRGEKSKEATHRINLWWHYWARSVRSHQLHGQKAPLQEYWKPQRIYAQCKRHGRGDCTHSALLHTLRQEAKSEHAHVEQIKAENVYVLTHKKHKWYSCTGLTKIWYHFIALHSDNSQRVVLSPRAWKWLTQPTAAVLYVLCFPAW